MGVERRSTVIDGVTYEVTQLGATQASKVLLRILSCISEPLALATVGAGSEAPSEKMAQAISKFVLSINPMDMDLVIKPLLDSLTADGVYVKPIFDDYFAGKIGRLVRLVVWAAKENFSDFFDESVAMLKAAVT